MTHHRGRAVALITALVLGVGCGSDAQRAATALDLEADGDGPANDEALLPLALGYRVERATRVMVVAERSDRFGEAAWVLTETLPTPPTNAPDRTPTTWWLAERDDGLAVLAIDGEPLPKPARLVPRHLHAGDRWVFRDGSGKVFGAARALGGAEADTIYGRRKVFTIAFSFERPRFVAGAWRLAEGRGFVDDVRAAVFPLAPAAPVDPSGERLALTRFGPELAGAQAVSVSAVAGAGPDGELAVRVGVISGAPTAESPGVACLLAGPSDARLQTGEPDPTGAPINVFGLADDPACSEAAVTRPPGTTAGPRDAAVDVQGRRVVREIAVCDPGVGLCYALATSHVGLFADGADLRGLAFDLRSDATGTHQEVITSLRAAPPPSFDPVLWRQDPAEFADASAVTWRDGLGFEDVPPDRAVIRAPMAAEPTASTDVLLLRRGRAATARLGHAIGPDARVGLVGGRDGPLQVEPWSVTLGADGVRRATTLSADGRVDELLWDGGVVRRRTLARVALPAGERGVGVVLDGARGLVVVTSRAAEGTFEQPLPTMFSWQYDSRARFYRATLPIDPSAVAAAPTPPWLDVEVEGSGPDLRVCSGTARPATTGWTLGGAAVQALATAERCVVLVRPVTPPPATVADALATQIPSDAFVAEGELPGIGRALVAVKALDPTPLYPLGPPLVRPMVARGALDRGFADGAQEAPRPLPAGAALDAAGGVWRLGVGGATPTTCTGEGCVAVTYVGADGQPTSAAFSLPGAGAPRLVADPAGGVVVTRGELAAAVVHVATDGATSERPWPVSVDPAVEHWVVGPTTGLWRCGVGQRRIGQASADRMAIAGIECVSATGAEAHGPRCGRGLVCADAPTGDHVERGAVSACGGRVRFEVETGACELATPAAPDPLVVAAPDGVRFRLVEDDQWEGGTTTAPDGSTITGRTRAWHLARLVDDGAPVAVASGSRALRNDLGLAPIDPALLGDLSIAAGLDAVVVLDGAHPVARVLRDDAPDLTPLCGAACLGAPGSDVAPAPSCAAAGHAGPALVDPDGIGGPFPAMTVECADVPGLGLAAVGADVYAEAAGAVPPDGCSDLQPIGTVHGAFSVRASFPGNPLSEPALAFDHPDLSPSHDGLGAWDTTTCATPGRLVIGLGRDATNHEVLEVRDGLVTTLIPGDYRGGDVEVRRDAAGTLTVRRDGDVIYSRATGKLVPLRVASRAPIAAFAWAGSACAPSDDAWPSAPAVCACAPVDCGARHADCGTVDDGCGRLQACGGCDGATACGDNACGCARDASEVDPAAAHALGTGYHATFAGTFHDAADVDRLGYASPIEIAKTNEYHVDATVAGPPGATFALSLEGHVPGTSCALSCASGTAGSGGPITGGTTCSATGTHVTLVVSCIGFQVSGVDLGFTVSPTTWDASCVPYDLALDVVAQ